MDFQIYSGKEVAPIYKNPEYELDNIILIGFMGSGKTSIGKCISSISYYSFLDTDELIEEQIGNTIADIFKIYGERFFRKKETVILESLLEEKINCKVIATGGGILNSKRNILLLKRLGKLFFLKNRKKELLKRILNDKKRPLRSVLDLYEKRQYCYSSTADHIIQCDSKTIEDIAEEILLLKKFKELR